MAHSRAVRGPDGEFRSGRLISDLGGRSASPLCSDGWAHVDRSTSHHLTGSTDGATGQTKSRGCIGTKPLANRTTS